MTENALLPFTRQVPFPWADSLARWLVAANQWMLKIGKFAKVPNFKPTVEVACTTIEATMVCLKHALPTVPKCSMQAQKNLHSRNERPSMILVLWAYLIAG